MKVTDDPRLHAEIGSHPFPLLFVTVSGAHLYGFPSPNSDFDLRGVHLLPLRDVVGLRAGRETVEVSGVRDGAEMDLVTHDAGKYFRMVLKKNGYVLEQILSPLVLRTGPAHEELKAIARACVTRHHCHHYLGFAHTQWRLFEKESPPRVKPLLYVYRVLLTGIHLMRTGEVECDVGRLDPAGVKFIPELVARKREGGEHGTLQGAEVEVHRAHVERLVALLKEEADRSGLPETPAGSRALDDLLVRLRLGA